MVPSPPLMGSARKLFDFFWPKHVTKHEIFFRMLCEMFLACFVDMRIFFRIIRKYYALLKNKINVWGYRIGDPPLQLGRCMASWGCLACLLAWSTIALGPMPRASSWRFNHIIATLFVYLLGSVGSVGASWSGRTGSCSSCLG